MMDFAALAANKFYTTQPAAPVQEWMKPHPKCDEACLFQCTKGFTQFPECAITSPSAPVQEPDELKHIGEQDCLLDVDEKAWRSLVNNAVFKIKKNEQIH
jgi:hypothetical protein